MNEQIAAIRAALEASTQGKWEWHGIAAPDWLPGTVIAADNVRVTHNTPDGIADQEIVFVIEAMKSGFVMVRNADAELIVNAPGWLRDLLAENARLQVQAERDALRMKCLEAEMDMDSHAAAMRAYEAALSELDAPEG